jgi:hypothetical protein
VVVVTTAVVLSIFSILLASNWLFTRATTMWRSTSYLPCKIKNCNMFPAEQFSSIRPIILEGMYLRLLWCCYIWLNFNLLLLLWLT